MSNELCLIGKQLLTDIANAIRSKTGKTVLIYPKDMDTEILSIETGLSPITVNIVQSANQTIKVNTSNISDWTNKTTSGTYSAPTGIRLTATITPANGYSAGSLNQSSLIANWGDTVTFQATPATEEEVGILNVAMSSVFKDAPTSGDPNFNETIDVTYTFTAVGGATPSTLFEDTNRNDTFEVIALEKNETFTYVSSFIVSESDILQGYVDCDVLTSTEPFTKSGSFEVETAVPNGSLAVTIDTSSYDEDNANAKEGDEISYDVNIENNGNLTINDIKVTSELAVQSYVKTELAPGESDSYTFSYTVAASDIENGYITADAQATGTSPDPDNPDVMDSATQDINLENTWAAVIYMVPEIVVLDSTTIQLTVTNEMNNRASSLYNSYFANIAPTLKTLYHNGMNVRSISPNSNLSTSNLNHYILDSSSIPLTDVTFATILDVNTTGFIEINNNSVFAITDNAIDLTGLEFDSIYPNGIFIVLGNFD